MLKFATRTALALPLLFGLFAGTTPALAQDQDQRGLPTPTPEELVRNPPPAFDREDMHTTIEADTELLNNLRNYPELFIGKHLLFTNGRYIGPIVDIRRKRDDLNLYLIVDATEFFNSDTTYAVMGKDVERYDEQSVYMPTDGAMHLRGLEYYPDDYMDLHEYGIE